MGLKDVKNAKPFEYKAKKKTRPPGDCAWSDGLSTV
jgi:hypothetical protein